MEPSNSIFQLPGTETSFLWVEHFSVINWKLQIKLFWVLHRQIINIFSSLWIAYIGISLVSSLTIKHVCVMYWVLKICFTLFPPFKKPIWINFPSKFKIFDRQVEFASQRFLRVDVEQWGMSLTLQSIGSDFDRTSGLCGNFDAKPFNDFHRRPDAEAGNAGITFKQINEFVERWRWPVTLLAFAFVKQNSLKHTIEHL